MGPTLYMYVFSLVNLYLMFISKIYKRNLEIFAEIEPGMKYRGTQNFSALYLIFKIKTALFYRPTSIHTHTHRNGSGWILFSQKIHTSLKASDGVIIANIQKMVKRVLEVTKG